MSAGADMALNIDHSPLLSGHVSMSSQKALLGIRESVVLLPKVGTVGTCFIYRSKSRYRTYPPRLLATPLATVC